MHFAGKRWHPATAGSPHSSFDSAFLLEAASAPFVDESIPSWRRVWRGGWWGSAGVVPCSVE